MKEFTKATSELVRYPGGNGTRTGVLPFSCEAAVQELHLSGLIQKLHLGDGGAAVGADQARWYMRWRDLRRTRISSTVGMRAGSARPAVSSFQGVASAGPPVSAEREQSSSCCLALLRDGSARRWSPTGHRKVPDIVGSETLK